MTLHEFRRQKSDGREELFKKILDTFKELDPLAIHQFGSGIFSYQDEFSDLDIWITFSDTDIDRIIKERDQIFEKIAPIVLKHEAPKNSPLEGKYSLVIHETPKGLFHVDYYLSRESKTVIRMDAKFLYGNDKLDRGEWLLDNEAVENKSLTEQIDAISFMAFIAVKGIIRDWKDGKFRGFVNEIYSRIEEFSGKKLTPLPQTLNFQLITTIFENIYPLASEEQQVAIDKIRKYSQEVETLYYG